METVARLPAGLESDQGRTPRASRVPGVRAAQVIGAIGRMMIRAGAILLLFVVYQLWGTGLQTARAQDDLDRQFQARLAEIRTEAPPASNGPAGTEPTTAPADLPPPEPGEPVGRIVIPDIGTDFMIVEGVDLKWLEQGPGHFPETPLPGQPGNAAIAGHRVTFAAPFHRVDELAPGAEITVETLQGTFYYEVLPQPSPNGDDPLGHYIIDPTQREILDDKGDNRITLMACHPKYSAAQRIVVEARLTSPPAPETPRPPPPAEPVEDPLLGGDSTAQVPALLFSLGAVALWFVAWFVAHRYRRWKWPAYGVALPFFAVLIFFAFANINRLLPAGY
jgi:sortase A